MDAKEIVKLVDKTVKALMPNQSAPKQQAMDAAELRKNLLVEISKRDALARQLVPFVGAFDASEMGVDEVAEYGISKLGLKADKGAAHAVLSGYLHNRTAPQPHQHFAQDSKGGGWLKSQMEGGK